MLGVDGWGGDDSNISGKEISLHVDIGGINSFDLHATVVPKIDAFLVSFVETSNGHNFL